MISVRRKAGKRGVKVASSVATVESVELNLVCEESRETRRHAGAKIEFASYLIVEARAEKQTTEGRNRLMFGKNL